MIRTAYASLALQAARPGAGILGPMMDGSRPIEVGGQVTRVLRTGQGDACVVLHGWSGRIESMTPVITCLAGAFDVFAIDLPGFGESPTPRGVWGTPDYAAYVRDVLMTEGIEKAHFVGHSFGGKVASYLAAVHPEMVDKLVLAGASGLRLPPSLPARAKKAAARAGRIAGAVPVAGRKVKDAIYERIASEDYKQAGPMRPIFVKVVNEDLSPLLPRVKAPTLLVWGEGDDSVPVAAARKMEQLIPDAGVVVLEGTGHFSYLDDQARFCRVIRHFFGAPVP